MYVTLDLSEIIRCVLVFFLSPLCFKRYLSILCRISLVWSTFDSFTSQTCVEKTLSFISSNFPTSKRRYVSHKITLIIFVKKDFFRKKQLPKWKWQQKKFLAHLKERLELFSKSFYSFFVSCFVFKILRPQTVRLSAILDLILPSEISMTSQQG